MQKEIAFKPGSFSPVVEVSQRQTGVPAPADTCFTGLEEVSKTTLLVATSSARGSGAFISDAVPVNKVAMVIGTILTLRNVIEQLSFIGVFTRVSSPAKSPNGEFLEPLIRAYGYYGHFINEGKTYVTRDLERFLVRALFALRQYATSEVADGSKHTVKVPKNYDDIDFDFYHLGSSGDIEFGKKLGLKDYIVKLVKYVADFGSVDARIPLLQQILDVATEDGLNALLRHLRTIPTFEVPTRDSDENPSDAHKKAMKELFGAEYSAADDAIPVPKLVEGINNAYHLLRRISLERQYGMKTVRFPVYEGGSASQLASCRDDVLFSQVPLSLSDSTAALAMKMTYGALHRFQSAPGHEKEELLRELVAQSLIKR
jgi:hypothetical protein